MSQLVLATHNRGKVEEMAGLLSGLGVTLKTAADFNCPEPEETGDTFLENALLKARFVSQFTGETVLADDSGLCVAALDDAPGVYSADWAGNPRDFTKAMARVVSELLAKGVAQPWRASFHAIIVLCRPDGDFEVFQGKCDGQILPAPRGEHGHGYDPIFMPEGADKTFAEMTLDEKNQFSHRAKAIAALLDAWPSVGIQADDVQK